MGRALLVFAVAAATLAYGCDALLTTRHTLRRPARRRHPVRLSMATDEKPIGKSFRVTGKPPTGIPDHQRGDADRHSSA